MKIRIAGLVNDSIVDGPGFRFTIFTQGCPHSCPGCHNPETHDFAKGHDDETDDILLKISENPLLDGITLSGGEPFCQPEACLILAEEAHKMNLNVWIYSGYTFEQLSEGTQNQRRLLSACDVLVDGVYLQAQRSLNIPWRGSKNQRVIDIPQSLAAGQPVCVEGM